MVPFAFVAYSARMLSLGAKTRGGGRHQRGPGESLPTRDKGATLHHCVRWSDVGFLVSDVQD